MERMDRKALNNLSENFKAFIAPLLDQDDPEDYRLIWEFQKFFHTKRLKVMTAEANGLKKWKAMLQTN